MNDNIPFSNSQVLDLSVKANQYLGQRKFLEAISVYQELQGILGEVADIFRAISYCYCMAATYSQIGAEGYHTAISFIERAIELEPDNPDHYVALGELYCFSHVDYERAISCFRKALSINPNCIQALGMGEYLVDVPEDVISMSEAIDWLERAVQIDPQPMLHLFLGRLYLKANRREDAKKEWLKSLLSTTVIDSQRRESMYQEIIDNKMF
jgi:tetratricopeptide (TPR) repeat protein